MKKSLLFVSALLLTVTVFAEVINIDVTADALAEKYGWANGKEYRTVALDGNITLYVNSNTGGTSNSGMYYTGDWRMYQARVDSFFIEAANGATFETIQLTYTDGGKNGTLSSVRGVNVDNSLRIASDSVLNVSGKTQVCLYLASTKDGITNAQARISRFRISYNGNATKEDPTFKYSLKNIYKRIGDGKYKNELANTSDGVLSYESSDTNIATVASDGTVTFVAEGDVTITANVASSDKFNAASAFYTLHIRGDKWNMETFEGAQFGGTSTYYTTPTSSEAPSEATGLTWTAFLGSVRDNLGGFDGIASVIRQRKSSESEFDPAYLVSSTITGGIDSLAFRWNSNGNETGNWNIAILVNTDTIGKITAEATSMFPSGEQATFAVGGLKKTGDFTLKFINMAEVSTKTDNTKRFCIDNIEWYSYSDGSATGLDSVESAEKAVKVIIDGTLYIRRGNELYSALGQKL